MATKQLGIRIPDEKIYEKFIKHVEKKYGTKKGHMGFELQKSMLHYLRNIDNEQELDEITKNLKKATETNTTLKKMYEDKIEKLKQKLKIAESFIKQTKKLQKLNQEQKKDIEILRKEKEYLQDLQEKGEQLETDYNKLRNRFDHLQERFNKSQNELNMLERENSQLRVIITRIDEMSFLERVLKRLPTEVKQIKEKNKIK